MDTDWLPAHWQVDDWESIIGSVAPSREEAMLASWNERWSFYAGEPALHVRNVNFVAIKGHTTAEGLLADSLNRAGSLHDFRYAGFDEEWSRHRYEGKSGVIRVWPARWPFRGVQIDLRERQDKEVEDVTIDYSALAAFISLFRRSDMTPARFEMKSIINVDDQGRFEPWTLKLHADGSSGELRFWEPILKRLKFRKSQDTRVCWIKELETHTITFTAGAGSAVVTQQFTEEGWEP